MRVVWRGVATMSLTPRPTLKGVVFDLDGTLTVPKLDFDLMYSRCGVERGKDILVEMASMEASERARVMGIIDELEKEAREATALRAGVKEVAAWLGAHEVRAGLVTRNSRETVEDFASRFWPESPKLSPALSRDDPFPAKPDPSALKYAASVWGASPDEVVMVGDSVANDVASGKAFGATTVLVRGGEHVPDEDGDVVLDELLGLPAALWRRFHIDGPLGTRTPLLKYETPTPTHPACVAAVSGDVRGAVACVDACDVQTPLVWAADAGKLDVVDALLNAGADVNAKGYIGATALSRAARNGDLDVLARLVHAPGVDLDAPNHKLQFPLHFAAFKRHRAAVRVLLDAGASTTVFDRKGRTPAEDTADPDIKADILAARAGRFLSSQQGGSV